MVAIMLMEEVKPLAQFQAQRRSHNTSFRHLPPLPSQVSPSRESQTEEAKLISLKILSFKSF